MSQVNPMPALKLQLPADAAEQHVRAQLKFSQIKYQTISSVIFVVSIG